MPEGSILDQLEQERSEARERLTQANDARNKARRARSEADSSVGFHF